MPNPPRGVVLAAVAGAEPATPLAARIGRLVAKRHAAQVGADADQNDPLVVASLHPCRIGLRLDQLAPEWMEAVIAESPRMEMKHQFIEVIGAEATKKPYSGAAALIENFGFLELISGAPFDE